jgi:glycosidase
MTVAEMGGTTVEMASEYLGERGDGLDMIFHFEHMDIDAGPDGKFDLEGWGEWDLTEFKQVMSRWQTDLDDGWNAQYLGNHDQPRIVSRFGDDEAFRTESAKLLATFLLTTRGTPYLYQGDEIGMTNEDFATVDDLDDPMTIGAIEEYLGAGVVDDYEALREFVNYVSRDHSRTPMQWSGDRHAGFTDGEPWFGANENFHDINVESAVADESSIWHHYRALIDLRHREDALVYGEYELLLPDDEQLYVYTRTLGDERFLVVLNWSASPATVDVTEPAVRSGLVLGNYPDTPAVPTGETFRPYEAAVYRC